MRSIFVLIALLAASQVLSATATVSAYDPSAGVPAGDVLITACGNNDTTDTVTSVTDNLNNTYLRINYTFQPIVRGGTSLWVYYSVVTTGGPITVTFHGNSPCTYGWSLEGHFTGPFAIDGSSHNYDASGSCDPGPITTTGPGFVFGICVAGAAGSVGTESAGYTLGSTSNGDEDSEYRITSSAGTYDATFNSNSANWLAMAVAFSEPAAAPALAKRRILF